MTQISINTTSSPILGFSQKRLAYIRQCPCLRARGYGLRYAQPFYPRQYSTNERRQHFLENNLFLILNESKLHTYIPVCTLDSAPVHSIVRSTMPNVFVIFSAIVFPSLQSTLNTSSAPNFFATAKRFSSRSNRKN